MGAGRARREAEVSDDDFAIGLTVGQENDSGGFFSRRSDGGRAREGRVASRRTTTDDARSTRPATASSVSSPPAPRSSRPSAPVASLARARARTGAPSEARAPGARPRVSPPSRASSSCRRRRRRRRPRGRATRPPRPSGSGEEEEVETPGGIRSPRRAATSASPCVRKWRMIWSSRAFVWPARESNQSFRVTRPVLARTLGGARERPRALRRNSRDVPRTRRRRAQGGVAAAARADRLGGAAPDDDAPRRIDRRRPTRVDADGVVRLVRGRGRARRPRDARTSSRPPARRGRRRSRDAAHREHDRRAHPVPPAAPARVGDGVQRVVARARAAVAQRAPEGDHEPEEGVRVRGRVATDGGVRRGAERDGRGSRERRAIDATQVRSVSVPRRARRGHRGLGLPPAEAQRERGGDDAAGRHRRDGGVHRGQHRDVRRRERADGEVSREGGGGEERDGEERDGGGGGGRRRRRRRRRRRPGGGRGRTITTARSGSRGF